MLCAIHRSLRRHRRLALTLAAAVLVAGAAVSAHSIVTSMAMEGHDHGAGSDGVLTLCVTLGACVAGAGIAVFALRRPAQRPLWRIAPPALPVAAFVPGSAGVLVRAGPPPPVLQVFRF